MSPSIGTARVKSVSWPVVNSGVRATGATAVAIFDATSQAATGAHSNWTAIGPSVLNQSRADWLVTSPTAIPCGNRFAEAEDVSAKGLPEGSPSRDANTQLNRVGAQTRRSTSRRNWCIMGNGLPERGQRVKHRSLSGRILVVGQFELIKFAISGRGQFQVNLNCLSWMLVVMNAMIAMMLMIVCF